MFLNPYVYQKLEEKTYADMESIVKANITFHNRKIYIVSNKQESVYENNLSSIFDNYKKYNIILINISKSRDGLGRDIYIKSTYSFDCFSSEENIISAFKNAKLHLNYALTNGYSFDETDYKNLYYNDLGFTFGYEENNDNIEINLNDMFMEIDIEDETLNEKVKIPDPRYYTNEQYKIDKGTEYGMVMTYSRTYNGVDLLDDATDIYYIDMSEKRLSQKAMGETSLVPIHDYDKIFETYEKYNDINSIPFDMFLINAQSCFSSYKFIYDSKSGFNIKDIKSDHVLAEDRRKDYLEEIAKKMNRMCNKLTKEYGNLRVYYYSNDIVDKVQINFDNKSIGDISISLDKNSTFERLMVYLTDKYEKVFNKPPVNYETIDDEYFSLT